MIKNIKFCLIGALLIMALIGTVAASNTTTYGYESLTGTAKGPLGILVSLGFEQIPGLTNDQIMFFYLLTSVGMLFIMGAVASERNLRHFGILLPIIAGLLIYLGWLQSSNQSGLVGMVVGAAFLGGVIYMKESLRENWGVGGPGTTILNIAIFLIILQSVVGVVNSPNINMFNNQNVAETPSEWQNIDLGQHVTSISNTGGLLQDVLSSGSLFVTMAIGALQAIVSIVQSIVLFSATLMQIFPLLSSSPFALLLLVPLQIGIWVLYAKLAYDMFYTKSPWMEV